MAGNLFKETFSHVRSSYEFRMEDFEPKKPEKRPRRAFPVKKLLLTAAAVGVLAAFGITASATGFFGLAEPAATGGPEHEPPAIPVSGDVLFVESYNETDEAKAWDEFVRGQAPQEEAAAKYGLAVSQRSEVFTYAELTDLLGGELLAAGHAPAAADVEEDGSFRLEGTFLGPDGERVPYELVRSVKGTMNYTLLCHLEGRDIRPFDAGERTLALVEGGGETLMAADLGSCWAAVRLAGDTPDTGLLRALGGSVDWELLEAVARPVFPEEAPPIAFGAGVALKAENIIADQSFRVNLVGLGKVRFVSYAPTQEFTDVRFFFTADGETSLSELTPVLTGLAFQKVAAVSFEDLNGDGRADILLLIDYIDGEGEPYRVARIYTAVGNGTFNQETRISRNLMAAVDNRRLDVAAVRAYLRTSDAGTLAVGPEGYARILAENLETYQDDYFTRYALFDLTGDGEPELLAGTGTCEADAMWEVWTMKDGQVRRLGEIGAGHALLYDCGGELWRVTGQMGQESVDKLLWNGEAIVEERVSERELGVFESYVRPGRALLMMPADDTSLFEPMSFEELIDRTGAVYAGPESLAEYALLDLTGDGGEELIMRVESGSAACYRFYALSQGRAVPLGTLAAGGDNVLAADGATLYLIERDLASGSERIDTVTVTDTITVTPLTSRTNLSPSAFTDPERLGQIVQMKPTGK